MDNLDDPVLMQLRAARPEDLTAVERLLTHDALPLEGVSEHITHGFVVAIDNDRIVGVAGIEVYEDAGLLRSVAVEQSLRGKGLGAALVSDRLAWARAQGLREIYLLTTTAKDFFDRLGFEVTDRANAPAAMQKAPEFAYLCASTATTMKLSL